MWIPPSQRLQRSSILNETPTPKSGRLKGLLLTGLVGLCLAWGLNQGGVWMLEKRAATWEPTPLPKLLPRRVEPAGPVAFAPGIIEEQSASAEEAVVEDVERAEEVSSEAASSAPAAPAGSSTPSEASPAKKRAASKKPAPPTRVFTADRNALKTQFKKASDLYAHGHYRANEEDGGQRGIRFAQVAPGGVFAQFGLQTDDIILSINGTPLNNQNDVLANFEKMRKMDVLNMRLERDGKLIHHRYIFK